MAETSLAAALDTPSESHSQRTREVRFTGPTAMVDDWPIMTVFLVLLFPLLLMVFALLMGRVEDQLQSATVTEDEVEEFLEQARPDEVNTFIREGWTGALARFRLRRRPRGRKVRKA